MDCASNKCGQTALQVKLSIQALFTLIYNPLLLIVPKVKASYGRQLDVVCHHHLQKKKGQH